MKYELTKIVSKTLDVDFQKIFDYLIKEGDTYNDIYDMSEAFGDNTHYYLKNIYGINFEFNDPISENSDYFPYEDNENIVLQICDDFHSWLEENEENLQKYFQPKKKIGIYGGSFNPIHYGHIGVAKYVKEHVNDIDEVWLMVSPNNPLKDSKILAPEQERFEAVKDAIKDIPGLVASDFEFNLPRPSYTVDTLRALQKTYPSYEFSLIVGEDSLASITKWKDYEYILKNFVIYVYPRHGAQYDGTLNINYSYSLYKNIRIMHNAPYIDISSTEIRNGSKNQKPN